MARRASALPSLLPALVLAAAAVGLRAAETRWLLVTTNPNLTVLGDITSGRLRDIAVQLEQFRHAVALVLPGARQLSMPATLYVFDETRALQPYLRLLNGRPVPAAGRFMRNSDAAYMFVTAENYDAAAPIVFHEYTHMLLSTGVTRLPTWLSEGMAEYFSTFRLSSGDRRIVIGLAVPRHVDLLRRRTLVPVAQLLAADQRSPLYNEDDRRSIFYAQSWALVHYIIAEVPGGPAAISRYVNAVAQDTPPDRAFRDAFGGTPEAFDQRLVEYVGRFGFRALTFELKEGLKVEGVPAPRPVGAAELEARLGDLQLRMTRVSEAIPRIEDAAANAQTAEPFIVLGQLRLQQNRLRDGFAALAKAVELKPDDFGALYAYGLTLARMPSQAASAGIANPRALAVSILSRAVTLNPFASEAYAMLATTHLAERRPEDARTAIERALALAPGRLDYRLRYADVLINQGSLSDAKTLLTGIMASEPTPPVAEMVRQRLSQIDEEERRLSTIAGTPPDTASPVEPAR